MDKIKIVWLCHFSNDFVRSKLRLKIDLINKVKLKLKKESVVALIPEFAIWITNGIREMEYNNEVELHVISPYPFLKSNIQEFVKDGVYYHFYKEELCIGVRKVIKKTFHIKKHKYTHNRRLISNFIKDVKPDIVHIFGAENPQYALSVLDIPPNIITIAQLQTLLNDEDIAKQYPDFPNYQHRAEVERIVIDNVNYIGTTSLKFRNLVHTTINNKVLFLNTSLALSEPIIIEPSCKEFTFVYFAANISKAADLALEAFGLAYQEISNITLDVIGAYSAAYKQQLDRIIKKYGIGNAVTFEGELATHEDVLKQIRKSSYALLPLKTDLISGTIRESMSNGLPVLTTDTGELGTQLLNQKRQNALLSSIGDHQALATNMLRLIKDTKLADTLRQNAFRTRSEAISNNNVIKKYIDVYKACIAYRNNGTPIPIDLIQL